MSAALSLAGIEREYLRAIIYARASICNGVQGYALDPSTTAAVCVVSVSIQSDPLPMQSGAKHSGRTGFYPSGTRVVMRKMKIV